MIVYCFRFDEFLIAAHQVPGHTVHAFVMQFGVLKWRELCIGTDVATHREKIRQSAVNAFAIRGMIPFSICSFTIEWEN